MQVFHHAYVCSFGNITKKSTHQIHYSELKHSLNKKQLNSCKYTAE